MKNRERKRMVLRMLQHGRCAITHEAIKSGDWVDLHHAIRPDAEWARARWPEFNDSILNLQLVLHGAHMWRGKKKPRIVTDAIVDRLERYLRDNPEVSDKVNCRTEVLDLADITTILRWVWILAEREAA